MKFYVPQFIDVEDKIFGPLSFKQFVYLVGGGGLAYLFFELFPIYIAIFPIVLVVALALALAFYEINNKPFIHILRAATLYLMEGKLYVWKKEDKVPQPREKKELESPINAYIPRLSDSKLKDLSWSLGVQDSLYISEGKERHPSKNE